MEMGQMDRVWIPLQGEGGAKPKAPAVANWQSPMYEGVHIAADEHHEAWLGLRTDGMVVVDFDTDAAYVSWHELHGPASISYTRKTPHGYHIFYSWTPGSPDGNRVRVLPDTDIRAGRGGQVAFYAPNYADVGGSLDELTPFDPSWLPEPKAGMQTDYEWDTIPVGRGNITMTSLAGTLRRQGATFPTILRALAAFNAITMPEEPMTDDQLIQIAKSVSRYEADPDVEEFKIVGADDDDADEDDEGTEDAPRYLSLHAMPKPEETTWLLEPFVPNDTLTLLDGEEGIGKGMFCVMLAAQMIFSETPRNVLWYSTEDTPDQIHARILEFGNVEDAAGDVAFWNQVHPFPTFPRAAEQIDADIEAFNPGLIILDAGKDMLDSSATPGEQFSTWSAHAVRPGLLALMRLAQKRKVPIIFIAHWNKTKGGIRERSADSNAFRQVVRQHVAIAEVGLLKAISVEKSNLKRGKAFTVHSCKIVNGRFEITRHLPAFQSLLEWIKAQEGDGDTEIKVERSAPAPH